jgi:4'-phosphopantetheinyl transferase
VRSINDTRMAGWAQDVNVPGGAGPLRDAVHVWVVSVSPGLHGVGRLLEAAGAAAHARAARFHRREDGERYLAAHGALRLIIAGCLGCDPQDVSVSAHAKGKPFIEGTDLQFNLSHSGDFALIGVAMRRQVGVDIERLRPIADLEALASRVCTPRERAHLATLDEPSREHAFLVMWTRKEALIKMTGEGVGALWRAGDREAPAGCRLMELDDISGYAACIAAEGTDWQLVRHSMNRR